MNTIEQMIQNKAYELGYEKCGIIPVHAMKDYAEKFEERIQKVPESKMFYQGQRRLLNPLDKYPWAKSIVVLASRYGKYKIPKYVKDHIAKAYLFDIRVDANSKEFQNSQNLEQYMQQLGLKTAADHKFGIVGLRWAAMQAGLGIIRRNNFFYTQYGSWMHIEAWLTDKDMELIETHNLQKCPNGCNRCITACPTHSLSSPYTMLPTACISYLTTFGGRDLPHEPLRKNFGNCIYGCDVCQDVCPMNRGKWEENYNFPNLSELAPFLTPENILNMEEEFYRKQIQPKFFYLSGSELWKWKVDVLCFMGNNYQEKYKPYITAACENKNEKIREMAQLICSELYA
ncbi:epoxyqueuosine reductase [Clostridium sp. Mt-5]|uniref:Epoxyqueuosine reductase n=1 Tax=Clostridium moutaii TaxID=3240932 RepID=A0ABV4BRC7_9CLOT